MSKHNRQNRDAEQARDDMPSHPQISIQMGWSVRRFREGTSQGPASIELSFPTEGGGKSSIHIPHRKLRHNRSLMDLLADRLPIFPTDVGSSESQQLHYIRSLVSSYGGPLELIPSRTGFVGLDAFATYSEVIYSDGRRQPIPQSADYVDIRGTKNGSEKVLKLARRSTYLAFGFGVALACPLPTYVRLHSGKGKDDKSNLTETAVFNMSGRSSSGKSNLILAAMSLACSYRRAGTLDVTARGLAETASDSNDMPLVLDDTEKAENIAGVLVKTLKNITHTVPGGRSKRISTGVDQARYPLLRWSTFGLCSSPKPISELAMQSGWEMSPGDKVRLFNISVPSSKKGGIFDLVTGKPKDRAKASVKLIANLERGYQNHHGHVFPDWVLYLMAKDRSSKILELVSEFVTEVGANNEGWETRFAEKFGYIYAAMVMGIKGGLLPWPDALPLQVAQRCYRKARKSAGTVEEELIKRLSRLHKLLRDERRVLDVPSQVAKGAVIEITKRSVAIRYWRGERQHYGVLDEALLAIAGSHKAKKALSELMAREGVIGEGHGHAGTVQERFKIERGGKVRSSIRVWSVNMDRLNRFLSNKSDAASG